MKEIQKDSPYLTIRSIDFNTCRISLHRTCTREFWPGEDGLAIDVPLNSVCIGEDHARLHLESHKRINRLEGLSFQFIDPDAYLGEPFEASLDQVLPYLRASLLNEGLLANNFNNFLKVLSKSDSRRLQCALIQCSEPWVVPEESLRKLRFRTLYANLFGGEHLTLGVYANLGEALEKINTQLKACWLDTKIHSCTPPVLLLLGEPEN